MLMLSKRVYHKHKESYQSLKSNSELKLGRHWILWLTEDNIWEEKLLRQENRQASRDFRSDQPG